MKYLLLCFLMLCAAEAGAGELPNAGATPGLANPRVTQANIKTTICVPGFTKTVRPSVAYTDALKNKMLGTSTYPLDTGKTVSDYELDHLIPLTVGGDPRSTKNLWPQPRWTANSATQKDALEVRANKLVCSGKVPLAVMQKAIAKDWIAASKQYK